MNRFHVSPQSVFRSEAFAAGLTVKPFALMHHFMFFKPVPPSKPFSTQVTPELVLSGVVLHVTGQVTFVLIAFVTQITGELLTTL